MENHLAPHGNLRTSGTWANRGFPFLVWDLMTPWGPLYFSCPERQGARRILCYRCSCNFDKTSLSHITVLYCHDSHLRKDESSDREMSLEEKEHGVGCVIRLYHISLSSVCIQTACLPLFLWSLEPLLLVPRRLHFTDVLFYSPLPLQAPLSNSSLERKGLMPYYCF